MQDKRSGSIPSTLTERVERAIFNLLLAEDHPWQLSKLQQELEKPRSLVMACVQRLQADGLVDCNGKTIRASRAAIRADELSL